VQEGDNLQLFNTSRTVFHHDGYWIISRSLADGSLCYFYSPDGVSWSGPRLIEPFWRYHDGRGAAVWKEPYPSPYVHIVYYGVDEVLGEYRGIVSGPRTLYYRRGEVRPGGVIEWGERVAVVRGIQLGFHGWEKGICVSENNVWILYQTWENENGWVAYLKCLNTGDILRLGNEVRVSESAADKQMCPLPGGRVALFSHTVYPVSPPLYAFQVRVVSTSGVESVENVYFGENTWNLNIVCSGGRLYVAFPRLERLENGDQQENVYVYGRFPEGWREVYRACVYTGGGRGVYRTPVSLTATPGGGLVLFFMRDYVWHPEGYYLGLLKTGVMVRSPDGMSWGPEEEVLHSDPDEVGFLFCDSSYYADNGRVPTFSLAVTRWVEYIPFPGRIWFWKGEVRVDNTPPVSSVDPIEPYWQLGELRDPPSDMRLRTPIKITATASDDLSGVAKVELWYRYSLDNWTDTVAWKKRPWRLYGVDDNGADGWSWAFDAPEGYGYYEFYSVAEDRARNREGLPVCEWIQTTKEDFENSLELENLDTETSPGNVILKENSFTGEFLSRVFDSGKYSTSWGTISWEENCPTGTDIIIQTRTGNTGYPDETWSGWSAPYENSEGEKITSPPAQYIQYRAILETENSGLTPVLHEIKITYPVADAGCRVAKELLRVAVILAEPADVEHDNIPMFSVRYPVLYQFNSREISTQYRKYFDEASYGSVFAILDFFDNDGNWYKLPKGWKECIEEKTIAGRKDNYFKHEFVTDAIELTQKTDPRFKPESYRAIIVVGATPSIIVDNWYETVKTGAYCFDIGDKRISCCIFDDFLTWVHETGHSLGLPDLYRDAPHSWGDIDNWGIMGSVRYVHFCSWSKERLGWLKQVEIGIPEQYDGLFFCYALPTQHYGEIFDYFFVDDSWKVWRTRTWYIVEYRISEQSGYKYYSSYDSNPPDTGLVLYRVQRSYWTRIWGHPCIEVVGWLRENGESFTAHEGKATTFTKLENRLEEWSDNVWRPVQLYRIHRGSPSGLVVTLFPMPYEEAYKGPVPQIRNQVRPDLDLHAYTYDGKHVGTNYGTGEYEKEILGAMALGDFMGSEWIQVPFGTEVYFTVSSHDTEVFLRKYQVENLWWLENENGFYGLQVKVSGENQVEYRSLSEGDGIPPGKEMLNVFEVRQLPDGTYKIEIKKAMDFLSFEAWLKAIGEIPDNVFIGQAPNRRHALENKFRAVFKMIEENNLKGAIQKLEHDILEKLDADGKADWVKEPVLVHETRALIGRLRYEMKAKGKRE
jgi:hypothetical protein